MSLKKVKGRKFIHRFILLLQNLHWVKIFTVGLLGKTKNNNPHLYRPFFHCALCHMLNELPPSPQTQCVYVKH